MKKTICPRCGSSNIDWIIPQVWSKWECKDCSYTGPAIEADDDLIAEIKADWEENKENILKRKTLGLNRSDPVKMKSWMRKWKLKRKMSLAKRKWIGS